MERASYSKRSWFRKNLMSWYGDNKRSFSWRKPQGFWFALVAEILLTQTDANRVVPVFEEFRRRFDSPEAVIAACESELTQLIRPLGFSYRAKTLRAAAQIMMGMERAPQEEAALLQISGVGKYAACAIQCFHWGKRVPIVDINVVRVITRFFGITPTLRAVERDPELRVLLESLLPKRKFKDFNYALLDLGAAACRSKPRCDQCPLAQNCSYRQSLSEGTADTVVASAV